MGVQDIRASGSRVVWTELTAAADTWMYQWHSEQAAAAYAQQVLAHPSEPSLSLKWLEACERSGDQRAYGQARKRCDRLLADPYQRAYLYLSWYWDRAEPQRPSHLCMRLSMAQLLGKDVLAQRPLADRSCLVQDVRPRGDQASLLYLAATRADSPADLSALLRYAGTPLSPALQAQLPRALYGAIQRQRPHHTAVLLRAGARPQTAQVLHALVDLALTNVHLLQRLIDDVVPANQTIAYDIGEATLLQLLLNRALLQSQTASCLDVAELAGELDVLWRNGANSNFVPDNSAFPAPGAQALALGAPVLAMLLAHGLEAAADLPPRPPLLLAAIEGNDADSMRLLLDYGADARQAGSGGLNAFERAAASGDATTLAYLRRRKTTTGAVAELFPARPLSFSECRTVLSPLMKLGDNALAPALARYNAWRSTLQEQGAAQPSLLAVFLPLIDPDHQETAMARLLLACRALPSLQQVTGFLRLLIRSVPPRQMHAFVAPLPWAPRLPGAEARGTVGCEGFYRMTTAALRAWNRYDAPSYGRFMEHWQGLITPTMSMTEAAWVLDLDLQLAALAESMLPNLADRAQRAKQRCLTDAAWLAEIEAFVRDNIDSTWTRLGNRLSRLADPFARLKGGSNPAVPGVKAPHAQPPPHASTATKPAAARIYNAPRPPPLPDALAAIQAWVATQPRPLTPLFFRELNTVARLEVDPLVTALTDDDVLEELQADPPNAAAVQAYIEALTLLLGEPLLKQLLSRNQAQQSAGNSQIKKRLLRIHPDKLRARNTLPGAEIEAGEALTYAVNSVLRGLNDLASTTVAAAFRTPT
jgi:hypothetical protein